MIRYGVFLHFMPSPRSTIISTFSKFLIKNEIIVQFSSTIIGDIQTT